MSRSAADYINILGDFCGIRDMEEINGDIHADVCVLFGGSILAGGDILARAIQNKTADTYLIVGGAGHTTETLREKFREEFPDISVDKETEACIFQRYLKEKYGLQADYLETKSTNCGNNITNLLELLEENEISCSRILLMQDATMQRRMGATLRKHRPDMEVIHYATYRAVAEEKEGELLFTEKIHGMWTVERYIHLLMGEIRRLTDDANGYGPAGKGYIAHEDIPPEVLEAFRKLKEIYPDSVREANPAFAG